MPSVIGGASGVLDSVNVKPRKELVNDTRICRKIRKRESREREEIARKYSTTDIRINYSQLNSFNLRYLVSVPIGRYAFVRNTHAKATYASELIPKAQVECICLALVARQARCVQLNHR